MSDIRTPEDNNSEDRPRRRRGIVPGVPRLRVFVSSVMRPEVNWAREQAFAVLDQPTWLVPWLFERTPASSDAADDSYLQAVRTAAVVIWLVGRETTEAVCKEIREALASNRRLLVFLLPVEQRDDTTRALLDEVRRTVKYYDVPTNEDFADALALALAGEITRAMCGEPGLGRVAHLDEMERISRAQCIARWQAAGVPRALAGELADDPQVGRLPRRLQPGEDRPLVLLLGDMGAGKTLAAERVFQAAVAAARDRADAPVPVYLRFVDCGSQRLADAVLAASVGLGNPRIQGAVVVIDGGDEAGAGAAGALLDEARVLAGMWPRVAVIVTSRPMPIFDEAEEAVPMPLLRKPDVYALISRCSGRAVKETWAWHWPESVRDAIRRPLFALLLAAHIRERNETNPRSLGELIAGLVERSLRSSPIGETDLDQMLQRLAREVTDRRCSLIPASEIAGDNQLQFVLASRLVVERAGALAFALPALAEWFAARSLLAGHPATAELAGDPVRLEAWRYPLIVSVAMASWEQAYAIVQPIAEAQPAFAAGVVMDSLARWGVEAPVALPPSAEAGVRVRATMQAWVDGIGPLARAIAPVESNGNLLPLGTLSAGSTLITAWYSGPQPSPAVAELPTDFNFFRPPQGWHGGKLARPGRQQAWPWRWTLEQLTARLSRVIDAQALAVDSGPLAREAVWAAAIDLVGRGEYSRGPISVARLQALAGEVPRGALVKGRHGIYDLEPLRRELEQLHLAGETELRAPWPEPDQHVPPGWIWDEYSSERLFDRVKAVYEAALEAYCSLVATWFARLAARLRTAVILPARLVGTYFPAVTGTGRGPAMKWYLEPLPHGSRSVVDIQVAATDESSHAADFELLRQADQRLRNMRPEAAVWIHHSLMTQVMDHVLSLRPVTQTVYEWLESDLKGISWLA